MENIPSVGVVVLNYNGKDVLPELLDSLTNCIYPNLKIFLVDNASLDGSDKLARNWLDKLPMEIIRNQENLLFSDGNNVGIKLALDWGAEFVFLLNNDTIVPQDLISVLIKYMLDNPTVGIAGPLIHFGSPQNKIWGAGGTVNTWWGLVRHRGIRQTDSGQFNQSSVVDYVSGAALMVRKDVISKIGMLDPAFPMYYEDTDFCFRARKAGFLIHYVPTPPLVHLVSIAAGGQKSLFKIRRRFISGMKFFARHAQWYQWPTILLGQIYEVFRVLFLMRRGL